MQEKGLTFDEVERRIQDHGLNALPEKPPPSNFSLVMSQLKSPLVYVLLAAGLVTLFLHEYTDSLVIAIAVFINTVLGYVQEKRAGQALRVLKELIHPEAKVIRNGEMQTIDVTHLVPGDLVILNKGDKIPADGKLTHANRLFMSEAILTGESVPVTKSKDDVVYMGTVVTAGQAKFVVEKTGVATEVGKIAQSLEVIEGETPLRKQIVKFSQHLTILIISLTLLTFVVGLLHGISIREIFTTSVALAVSAIPEGLLVGLTVILAIGMQRILAQKGLVRNLVSAETLGGVTVICMDKTGTLTQGRMQVTDIIGNESELVLQTVIANDLDDPIVIAAYEWGVEKRNIDEEHYARLDSIPFDSENKFFVSLNRFDEDNNILLVNGAPEILLEKSTLDEGEKKLLLEQIENLTTQGKRVLGFARKMVEIDINELKMEDVDGDLEWVGMIAFSDPVRTDVKESLEKTKKAGIKLVVITGDYPKTAVSILGQIGIEVTEEDIILGNLLDKMSDEELSNRLYVNDNVKVFARTKPEQKLKIVQILKHKNEIVAMMGDGVNDAPAITAADIGIVVGEATDVAKESADLVLLDSSFKTIVLAIEEGRGIFDNLRKMILYLLSDAFVEIVLVLTAIMVKLPLPITAAQILWVNLVSDGFPNLALTVDPKAPGTMNKPPRSPKELLVSPWMRTLILIVSLTGGFFAVALFYYSYTKSGSLELARSVAFATVGINSLTYVFSIKALKDPFWKAQPFNNVWLLLGVVGGALLQVAPFVITPLRNMFKVVPIGNYWFVVVGASVLMFIVIELSKVIFRFKLEVK